MLSLREGPSTTHPWHDEYLVGYEYDSKRKPDGAARMYRIQLKAAA